MIFIDWATVDLPHRWEEGINGGTFVQYDRNNEVEKSVHKRLIVKSKWDTSLAIRTHINNNGDRFLEVSGNPTKFHQGHNVFGHGDLLSLMNQTIDVLCAGNLPPIPSELSPEEAEVMKEIRLSEGYFGSFYRVKPMENEREKWRKGHFKIKRIDLTAMVELSSRAEVRAVMNVLRYTATIHRRGAGSWYNGTLYFGLTDKGSRATPWMLKLYCKADEMKLNEVPQNIDDFDKPKAAREWGGDLPKNFPHRDELCAWADNKLRVELTLRTAELRKHGLQWAHSW